MLSDDEQRQALLAIKAEGGYGILCLIRRAGDVLFLASPVPKLRGYEIVCATEDRLYDVWKNGQLTKTDQTLEQIRDWIHRKTPAWLYDDSEVTPTQKRLAASWVADLQSRYPGTMVTG